MKIFGYTIGLVLLIGLAFFVRVNRHETISINMAPYPLLQRLADANTYPQWLQTDSGSVVYESRRANSGSLAWRAGNDSIHLYFTLLSSNDPLQTNLQMEWREPWVQRFGNSGIARALHRFKALVEDPARRYGFGIQLHPVEDSLILTRTAQAPRASADSTVNRLFLDLRASMKKADISPGSNYAFVSAVGEGNGEVAYAVGIPVKQRLLMGDTLSLLALPANGRLLIGTATFAERDALAKAMDAYVYDQRLKRVAQPMGSYPFDEKGLRRDPGQAYRLIFPVY